MAEPSALTLSEQIRVSLEADILSGALTPGQRLDEQEIAVRFNASRTPVREALRGLEARSMIIWEARRGPTVRVLSLGEVIDMFQVMAEMEGLCARLANVAIPAFPDTETTFADLQHRIAKTVEFIKTLKPEQFEGGEKREITLKLGPQEVKWSGQVYLLNFGLPNFFFHVTTAYDILRHNGVELGKRDFMGSF